MRASPQRPGFCVETSLTGSGWWVWDSQCSNQHVGIYLGDPISQMVYSLTPNHTFFPHDTTSLSWFYYIIWLVQNTVRWYFHAAFIDLRLEKLAPSKVRVRNLGRAEGCQGQGQGKRLLLGWEAGSHRRKSALPVAWKGSEGFLNRFETKPRIPENTQASLSGWDS